jgi:hypothetical protein
MSHGSQRSTESLLADRRSSDEGPENAQYGVPLVASGESARTVPDFTRNLLRFASESGWGCPHALGRSCSYGNIGWHLDAFNAASACLAYNDLDRGHLDDRFETRGFLVHPAHWLANIKVLCGDRCYVDANQILLAREQGIIGKLPGLSTEQVSDLSKEDIFVKLLAISQIIWLCLQLSMRLGQGVPTTQLEVMTMGYVLCSATTYLLLLDRLKDITTVFEIDAVRYPTPNEMSSIASIGPAAFGLCRSTISLPNNSTHAKAETSEMRLSSSFAVVLFGSLHLASWGYEFPKQTESILWRASTVLTVTVVPAMFAVTAIARQLNKTFNTNLRLVSKTRVQLISIVVQFWILAPLFVTARAFILMEVIRSLAHQPLGSYETTWATYIPHVG